VSDKNNPVNKESDNNLKPVTSELRMICAFLSTCCIQRDLGFTSCLTNV